jgi:hypothetical protein
MPERIPFLPPRKNPIETLREGKAFFQDRDGHIEELNNIIPFTYKVGDSFTSQRDCIIETTIGLPLLVLANSQIEITDRLVRSKRIGPNQRAYAIKITSDVQIEKPTESGEILEVSVPHSILVRITPNQLSRKITPSPKGKIAPIWQRNKTENNT